MRIVLDLVTGQRLISRAWLWGEASLDPPPPPKRERGEAPGRSREYDRVGWHRGGGEWTKCA